MDTKNSPWSIGKHAKRSATLHLSSEDQLNYSPASDPIVLGGNYPQQTLPVFFNNVIGGVGNVVVRTQFNAEGAQLVGDDDYLVVAEQRGSALPVGTIIRPIRRVVIPRVAVAGVHLMSVLLPARLGVWTSGRCLIVSSTLI